MWTKGEKKQYLTSGITFLILFVLAFTVGFFSNKEHDPRYNVSPRYPYRSYRQTTQPYEDSYDQADKAKIAQIEKKTNQKSSLSTITSWLLRSLLKFFPGSVAQKKKL